MSKREPRARRKRHTFLALDISVVVFALVCAALGLLFFYRSVHRSFTKNAPAIAHITYKKHTVQRRFSERFLWGHTALDTPLYNGDLVRTAALSDATIVFINNDTITLSENTLVQILYTEKGALIDLNSGKLDMKSESGNLNVQINNTIIHAKNDSSVQIEAAADGTNFRLLGKGEAVVEQNGVQQTLEPDTAWTLSSAGALDSQDALVVRSPLPDSTFVSTTPPPPPYRAAVPFEWSTSGFTPKEYVRLEASRNRNFDTVERKLDLYGAGGAELELETGEWWWRAWRPEKESTREFVANGKIFVVENTKAADAETAQNLKLNDLLDNLNAENPVLLQGAPETPPLEAPRNLRPAENFLFGLNYLRNSRTFVFSCAAVSGADSYIWTFTRNGKTVTRTTSAPQCRLPAAALAQFQNGRCQWSVQAASASASGAGGEAARGPAASSYFRLDIPSAPAPVVKAPVEAAQ